MKLSKSTTILLNVILVLIIALLVKSAIASPKHAYAQGSTYSYKLASVGPTQEEILQSLQEYFTNIVKSLFTWGEGLFQFDNDKLPPEDKITIRLPLENIIIEGSRQLDEWQQLQDEIPGLDMALKFIDDASKANLHNVNLSVAEWRVVRFINSKNTIYQIVLAERKEIE